jgi:hypothetical protein
MAERETVEHSAFAPCPACGQEVQQAAWDPHAGWRRLEPPVLPVTGQPHVCPATMPREETQ